MKKLASPAHCAPDETAGGRRQSFRLSPIYFPKSCSFTAVSLEFSSKIYRIARVSFRCAMTRKCTSARSEPGVVSNRLFSTSVRTVPVARCNTIWKIFEDDMFTVSLFWYSAWKSKPLSTVLAIRFIASNKGPGEKKSTATAPIIGRLQIPEDELTTIVPPRYRFGQCAKIEM